MLAILHFFILAEKSSLFHTPNLRYLKNIQIFKVSLTLTRLFDKTNFQVDFHILHTPTVGGENLYNPIYWVWYESLPALLRECYPTLKYTM